MLTSVLVQDSGGNPMYKTQQVDTMKDSISLKYGDGTGTKYCGVRQFTISSVKKSASVDLITGTELLINPSTGVVSIYTADSTKIGTHIVTATVSVKQYS